MSKKNDLHNDTHHRELLENMKEAESRFKNGAEKEDFVIKAMTRRLSKALGLGWFARKIAGPIIPLLLRIAVRAVLTVLNEILGKDWLQEFGKERKKY